MKDPLPIHDRLRQREREKFQKENQGKVPVMDAKTLRHLCLENDGYETPELNDNLYVVFFFRIPPFNFVVFSYAHFKGFRKIEGLEPYTKLKALWLESNGLYRIENLETLSELRCLYLSKNLLDRIENLEVLLYIFCIAIPVVFNLSLIRIFKIS